MNFFKKVILISAIFIMSFCANACEQFDKSFDVSNKSTISAFKFYENDFLNSKDNEPCFQLLNSGSRITSSNRNNTNGRNGTSVLSFKELGTHFESYIAKDIPVFKTHFKNRYLTYIIQPNAP